MSWAVGYDEKWQRDIGYGVPAICDHPDCNEQINRGFGHVCGWEEPYGGADGCGLYFCAGHGAGQLCERCELGQNPFEPKPDIEEWIHHKATDPSWAAWRADQAKGEE